jgi:hypothetical protein
LFALCWLPRLNLLFVPFFGLLNDSAELERPTSLLTAPASPDAGTVAQGDQLAKPRRAAESAR